MRLNFLGLGLSLAFLSLVSVQAEPTETADFDNAADTAQSAILSLLPDNYAARMCGKTKSLMFEEYKLHTASADAKKAGASKYIASAMAAELEKICYKDISLRVSAASSALSSKITASEFSAFSEFKASQIGGSFIAAARDGYEVIYFSPRDTTETDFEKMMDQAIDQKLKKMSSAEKEELMRMMNASMIRVFAQVRFAYEANNFFLPIEQLKNDQVNRITAVGQKASDVYFGGEPK
jgi:hypothetical protein